MNLLNKITIRCNSEFDKDKVSTIPNDHREGIDLLVGRLDEFIVEPLNKDNPPLRSIFAQIVKEIGVKQSAMKSKSKD